MISVKKILIVSTVSRQFYLFEQGNIEVLNSLGFEVHAAANYSDANERLNELNIVRHHFDIERSPFSMKNINAYLNLKKIIEEEKYDVIHCHSPVGGVLGRLAARALDIRKVIYTAHGFHFYKGAPFMNWFFYYPVERWLSKYTDLLITINNEDYNLAKRLNAKEVLHVPGIGVDIEKIEKAEVNKKEKLLQLGIPSDKFLLISVGELNKNKNHKVVIKAIAKMNNKDIHYIICGQGKSHQYLMNLCIKLRVQSQVHFLGYRNDVHEILKISDVFLFPSFREGLSVSLMEAMAAKLPVICSRIRGNVDLISEGEGGILINPKKENEVLKAVITLFKEKEMCKKMGSYNNNKSVHISKSKIKEYMELVYKAII